jgi:GNAT superfamily N-acetyltransferase
MRLRPGTGVSQGADVRIRPLASNDEAGLELVATRMRRTLVEVLGEKAGTALYTMDWLRARVSWHLDPEACTGEVFLAEDRDGRIVGHTIVRVDADGVGRPIGLFSTTYVQPEHRRRGIAKRLLARGEAWMTAHSMTEAVTYTASRNAALIDLFERHGYAVVEELSEMVKLAKALPLGRRGPSRRGRGSHAEKPKRRR